MMLVLTAIAYPNYPLENVEKIMISGDCIECKKVNIKIFDLEIRNSKYEGYINFDCSYCGSPIKVKIEGSLVSGKFDRPTVQISKNIKIISIYPVIVERR